MKDNKVDLMANAPKVVVVTIGDELLIGQTIDTNFSWIGSKVNAIGLPIDLKVSAPDTEEGILRALKIAESQADIILLTGGLGPTKDDITKKTLAEYLEVPLIFSEEAMQNIERYFEKRGKPVSEKNKAVALIPEGCEVIPNNRGTASGMWCKKKDKLFISMPGVPHEMKHMMEEVVLPRFQKQYALQPVQHKTLMTAGIPELSIEEKIQDIVEAFPEGVSVAFLPSLGSVRVRVTVLGHAPIENKEEWLEQTIISIEERVQSYAYGYDGKSLEAALGEIMRTQQKTVATAESCTGGLIAKRVVSVPGSSAYFKGSVVAYDYEMKEHLLGVPSDILNTVGAVSEECVQHMLKGVLESTNADFGVAVSGIAGPGGGTPEKPVGTVWICFGSREKSLTRKLQLPFSRIENIQSTATLALNYLRRFVAGDFH